MSVCYPVALNLERKPCLVVGGGALALEKVEGLLRAGATVTTVAPHPNQALADLESDGRIVLRRSEYRPDDLGGTYLAYGASADRALNARVASDARERGIIVNAVDDIPNCDFFAMAIVHRGDLQVAISTNGRSPAFARWMREELDASLPDELDGLLTLLGDIRSQLKASEAVPPYQTWRAAITPRVLELLQVGDADGADAALRSGLLPDQDAGTESAPDSGPPAALSSWKLRPLVETA